MEEKIERNSNIELLRILLMFFVITLHFYDAGGGNAIAIYQNGFGNYLCKVLRAFAVCAVDCFMIISGYFLAFNKKIKLKKICHILFIIIFINELNYFLFVSFGIGSFNLKHFIVELLPRNYFAIFYLILYVLSPFITKLFDSFSNKKQMLIFIGLLIAFFSIYPYLLDGFCSVSGYSLFGMSSISLFSGSDRGYTVVNFFLLFCIGSFIRRTDFEIKKAFFIVGYIFSILVIFALEFIPKLSFAHYESPFVILNAICLFKLFSFINFSDKTVNFVSSSTWMVFCLHGGIFFHEWWKFAEKITIHNTREGGGTIAYNSCHFGNVHRLLCISQPLKNNFITYNKKIE